MQRRNVDLPDPDGPITQATSPGCTARSMPRSTSTSPEALVHLERLDHRRGHVVTVPRSGARHDISREPVRTASSSPPEAALDEVSARSTAPRSRPGTRCRRRSAAGSSGIARVDVCTRASSSKYAMTTDERGRLEHRDRLVAGGRDDHPHRLRQHDPPQRLRRGTSPAPRPPRSARGRPTGCPPRTISAMYAASLSPSPSRDAAKSGMTAVGVDRDELRAERDAEPRRG